MRKSIMLIAIGMVIGITLGTVCSWRAFLWFEEKKGLLAGLQAGEFMAEEDYDSAIAILNQGIAFSPNDDMLYLGLAEAYEAKGLTYLAVAHYRKALDLGKKKGSIGMEAYMKAKIDELSKTQRTQ